MRKLTKKEQYEFLLHSYSDRIMDLQRFDNCLTECLVSGSREPSDTALLDMLYRSVDDARIRADSARRDFVDWILDNGECIRIVSSPP